MPGWEEGDREAYNCVCNLVGPFGRLRILIGVCSVDLVRLLLRFLLPAHGMVRLAERISFLDLLPSPPALSGGPSYESKRRDAALDTQCGISHGSGGSTGCFSKS